MKSSRNINMSRPGGSATEANNESSEVFEIIKPGRTVKIKGYRQQNVNNL